MFEQPIEIVMIKYNTGLSKNGNIDHAAEVINTRTGKRSYFRFDYSSGYYEIERSLAIKFGISGDEILYVNMKLQIRDFRSFTKNWEWLTPGPEAVAKSITKQWDGGK